MLWLILSCHQGEPISMDEVWWCTAAGTYGIFDDLLHECGGDRPLYGCEQVAPMTWICGDLEICVECEEDGDSCTVHVGPLSGEAEQCECEE